MNLSAGRHYLAIPGPSVVPDRVLQAMHRPAPNIYSGELVDMVPGIVADLKAVVGTQHHAAIYIGNGHAIWEAAVSNTLNRGDKVLLLSTGFFAHGWADMAGRLGVDVEVLEFGKRDAVDPARVTEALAADKNHEIKAVLAVHVDTATSAKSDIPAVRAAIDAADHPAAFMVDCIASLGCDEFKMDEWRVDLVVAACQKGLMTSPGVGFLFFNDRAEALRENCSYTSGYWDWRPRSNPAIFSNYFCGTAPTHQLYGLREALDMIAEEGLPNIWARHERLAQAYWAAVDVWGQDGPMHLNIAESGIRSHAVTSVRIGSPHGTALRDWLSENAGVTLGIGLGMADLGDPAWHGFFRFGHMGHVNAHMVMGVLGTVDAGLKALKIPHGSGALDAASSVLAAK